MSIAPSERQAEETYLRGHAERRFDKAVAFGGVEIFPVTGLPEERQAVVTLLAHGTSAETEWPILFQQGRYSPNCSEPAHSHADAMQIFLFCMAAFATPRLCCDLLGLWRARRDSNS